MPLCFIKLQRSTLKQAILSQMLCISVAIIFCVLFHHILQKTKLVDKVFSKQFHLHNQNLDSEARVRKTEVFSFGKILWKAYSLLGWFDTFRRNFAVFGNDGGMRLPHQFAVFAVLKILKPTCIIESGVWRGATTKLIHRVLPESRIISIDPMCFKKVSQKHDAICGKNFKDFKDLGKHFQQIDKNDTLVIFDDHQSGFLRVLQAAKFGFKYVMVEDNFQMGSGDNYSPKQVLTNTNSNDVLFKDNFGKSTKTITNEQHYHNRAVFKSVVKTYHEFPPLNKNLTVKWLAKRFRKSEKYFDSITAPGLNLSVPSNEDFCTLRVYVFYGTWEQCW